MHEIYIHHDTLLLQSTPPIRKPLAVNLTGKSGGSMAKHMNSFTSPAKKSFFGSRKSSSNA